MANYEGTPSGRRSKRGYAVAMAICIKLVEAERPGDGGRCYLFLATAVRPRIRRVTNSTTCDLRTDGSMGIDKQQLPIYCMVAICECMSCERV